MTDDTGTTLGDTLPDTADAYIDANDRIYTEQLHAALEEALAKLDEKLSDIIRLRYFDGLTLRRAGEAIVCTFQYARDLEGMAMRRLSGCKLRAFIEDSTDYYRRISVERFNTTHTSAVEELAMRREELERRYAGIRGED